MNLSVTDIRIRFTRNGHNVEKRVRWARGRGAGHLILGLEKAAREADRDIAAIQYGKDWPENCEITSNFWGPMTNDEVRGVFGV